MKVDVLIRVMMPVTLFSRGMSALYVMWCKPIDAKPQLTTTDGTVITQYGPKGV